MKDTITEMNNLHGINTGVDEADNQISNLEYEEIGNNQPEQLKEKRIKKWGECKEPLGQLQAYFIHIIGLREGEKSEQEIENYFKK